MIEIDMGRVFMRLGNYEFEIVVPEPATAEGTADLLRECLSRCVITHTYKPIPVPPGYVPVPGGLVDSLTGGPAPIPPEATGSNAYASSPNRRPGANDVTDVPGNAPSERS